MFDKKFRTKKRIKSSSSKISGKKNILSGGAMHKDNGGVELRERLNFFETEQYAVSLYTLSTNITTTVESVYKETTSKVTQKKFFIVNEPDGAPTLVKNLYLHGKITQLNLYKSFSSTIGSQGSNQNAGEVFNNNFKEYSDTFTKQLDHNFWCQNTSMTICNMHGSYYPGISPHFSVVPDNNLICFVSPVNYILQVEYEPEFHLPHLLNNMDYRLYKEIFKQHGFLRNIGFGNEDRSLSHLSYFNCLADCMWYYPGQVYPNISLDLTHSDFETPHPYDGIQYLGLQFPEGGGEPKVVNIPDTRYLNTDEIRKKIEPEGNFVEYYLDNIINYQKPNLNTKFKITFVIACRCFLNYELKKHDTLKTKIIYLEILMYHFNSKMLQNMRRMEPLVAAYSLKATCGLESSKTYSIFFNEKYYDPANSKYLNMNLDARVPNLEIIKNKIIENKADDKLKNITNCELNYLANQSFKKLFHFLLLLDENVRRNLVRKLLIHNCEELSELFKKFMNCLPHFTYKYGHDIELGYQESTLKYMAQLSGLLQQYSGINNLFIKSNLALFLEDVDKIKASNQIFSTSFELINSSIYDTLLVDKKRKYFEDYMREAKETPENIKTVIVKGDLNFRNKQNYPDIKKIILGKDFSCINIESPLSGQGFIDFDTLFSIFPNLEELVMKDIGETYIKNNRIKHKIKVLRLVNIKPKLNFLKFPSLEFLEITNNNCSSINLSHSNLENIILKDNFELSDIQITNPNLNTLEVVNCGPGSVAGWTHATALNFKVKSVDTLILNNVRKFKFNKCKISNLEIIDANLEIKELEEIKIKSSLLSLKKPKGYTSVKINFTYIYNERGYVDIGKKVIDIIKKFKNVEIGYIYSKEKKLIRLPAGEIISAFKKHTLRIDSNLVTLRRGETFPDNIRLF